MNQFSKEYLRALRIRLGLSQEKFAGMLGVSFSTVNRWESGKTKPSYLAQKMLRQLEEEINHNEQSSES